MMPWKRWGFQRAFQKDSCSKICNQCGVKCRIVGLSVDLSQFCSPLQYTYQFKKHNISSPLSKTCRKPGEFSTFVENLSKVFNKNFVGMSKTQASKIDYGGVWFLGGWGVCSSIVNPITLDTFNSIKIAQKSRKFILTIVK